MPDMDESAWEVARNTRTVWVSSVATVRTPAPVTPVPVFLSAPSTDHTTTGSKLPVPVTIALKVETLPGSTVAASGITVTPVITASGGAGSPPRGITVTVAVSDFNGSA